MTNVGQYVILAEYRLLNAIIHNPSVLDDGSINESMFPHELAKNYFRGISALQEASIPLTENAVLQKASELDYQATKDVTATIFSIERSAEDVNIEDCKNILQRAVQKQEFTSKLDDMIALTDSTELDIEAAKRELFDAEQILAKSHNQSTLRTLGDWFNSYLEDFKLRLHGNRYKFGDMLLDQALVKGAYPGAITTIAGGTGQGKSAYVLNLINRMINQQIPCMYISLEMSDIDTMDRLISLRKEIPTADLYHPDQAGGFDSLLNIITAERDLLLANNNFFFVDDPDLSLAQIEGFIKEFKQRTRTNYCIIAIDLITQIKDFTLSSSGGNLAQSIEQAMNKLNIIAKKHNVHFIAVAQFNREADSAKVQTVSDIDQLRPSLNNVKNAHAIAERSRAVLSVFRPKYYADRYCTDDPDYELMEDIMEIQVLKQSNGSTPRINYDFDGEIFRCSPILEDEEKEPNMEHMINY